uniref:Uncharacterized protein n=1 Tax=Arundo donax TaxID=35708 RepID=A0A0A9FCD3_ARUDO
MGNWGLRWVGFYRRRRRGARSAGRWWVGGIGWRGRPRIGDVARRTGRCGSIRER